MRGEVCIGLASFFSFAATLVLIFAHIGSTNHNAVARGIAVVSINVTGFAAALAQATGDPTPNFYTNNSNAPLGQGLGLRQTYRWGFYGHCAYTNVSTGQGMCTAEANGTVGYAFTPFKVLLGDIPPAYNTTASLLIPPSSFKNTSYTSSISKTGFYFIFLGSIFAALAFLTGLIRHRSTFTIATLSSFLAAVLILIGAAIWTALVKKMEEINTYKVYSVDLGIVTDFGIELWLVWSAFATVLLSIFPYFVSWNSYRARYK